MMENTKRIPTERLTLRLPNPLMNKLRQESNERDLPINALINRILNKSIMEDKRINALPSVIIPNILFENIINDLNQKSLEKISKLGQQITKKYFALQNEISNMDNLLTDYFIVTSKYAGWFTFRYDATYCRYRLVFETHLGHKWTNFVTNYVKSILSSHSIVIEKEEKDDNMVIFEIKTNEIINKNY